MAFDQLLRTNPDYVEALFREFQSDPESVDPGWAEFFQSAEFSALAARSDREPGGGAGLFDLVHSYRELGHLMADIDPLRYDDEAHPLLRLEEFGFSRSDLPRVFESTPFRGLEKTTLAELLEALRRTYCGTLGVEFLDIVEKKQRDWMLERMEPSRNLPKLSAAERQRVLDQLIAAEEFELFIHRKYPGQKRFSLEGGESLIVLLNSVIEDAARGGVDEIVIGMPHRGRLNVLAHVLGKPYGTILAEFEGAELPPDVQGDGDVKYHLGYSREHLTPDGHKIHISLASNPSHLEAVDPVIEGIARAKQAHRGDHERRRVLPLLLHGDAAFMGQGVVYETLALSRLSGFNTGGTIHVIINNQVGFTTSPEDYRPTRYPSDIAHIIHAPIFHVNGDDPEAVIQVARLAVGYRQTFGTDVFIDFVCYRRRGHNELDDPTLTQPLQYQWIVDHPPVTQIYGRRLEDHEGAAGEVQSKREGIRAELEEALAYARKFMPKQRVLAFGGLWAGFGPASDKSEIRPTSVGPEPLLLIAERCRELPDDFAAHKRQRTLFEHRLEMVRGGQGIDWGCGEMLGFGSLLLEGTPVRLSGQDSGRGTFSQRHAVLRDVVTNQPYIPLNHLAPAQAEIEVINSSLSEEAVLGFEYGMSAADPRRLVLWEAQFGDFENGAQTIIDEFIASAESKWQRQSGLVMLLPHGYEGQGPDHSSARLERFLQLCAQNNLQVVNCTTPAQYFHVLRRQIHRSFRKPLVIMTPKSLLRHPHAVSSLAEFSESGFARVLDDRRIEEPRRVRRVLLCSGRIYYALEDARAALGTPGRGADVAIVRVEELYPFPARELEAILSRYSEATSTCWVQEEPANGGAWNFVEARLNALLEAAGRRRVAYVGRSASASPAAGSYSAHRQQEEALLAEAVVLDGSSTARPVEDAAEGQASRSA
jgi:2-oxoglutarate dehydrogenase E1 component